jgi:hypothetical protein
VEPIMIGLMCLLSITVAALQSTNNHLRRRADDAERRLVEHREQQKALPPPPTISADLQAALSLLAQYPESFFYKQVLPPPPLAPLPATSSLLADLAKHSGQSVDDLHRAYVARTKEVYAHPAPALVSDELGLIFQPMITMLEGKKAWSVSVEGLECSFFDKESVDAINHAMQGDRLHRIKQRESRYLDKVIEQERTE